MCSYYNNKDHPAYDTLPGAVGSFDKAIQITFSMYKYFTFIRNVDCIEHTVIM